MFVVLAGSQLAESEEEKLFDEVGAPLNMSPEAIFPFSFPSYKSPDTKEDMVWPMFYSFKPGLNENWFYRK